MWCLYVIIAIASSQLYVESYENKYSFEVRYTEVPVDHFSTNPNPKTFKVRYLLNYKYHIKTGPVFVYAGHEKDINVFAQNAGFMFDIAPQFNALLLFIEHRYYGESLPFGNLTFSAPKYMRFLSSHQVLADYAFVIDDVHKTIFGDSKPYDERPYIIFGGGYGGMLAAWMRQKYPYLVKGAIASSAPILFFSNTNCNSFYQKVTEVYSKYGNEQCLKMIQLGWDVISDLTKSKLGRDYISARWKLCKNLKTQEDTSMLMKWLSNLYVTMATYNYHYPTEFYVSLPAYPVKAFCDKLTSSYITDSKGFIEQFSFALELPTNYSKKSPCNNIQSIQEDAEDFAWNYQLCTELIMPKCSTEEDMFLTNDWNYTDFSDECYKIFGVKVPRYDWPVLEHGDTTLKYYSNIVFSNGLMDPYSVGGVFRNVSATGWAVNISNAPAQVDLREPTLADNYYIMESRNVHINAIKSWIKTN